MTSYPNRDTASDIDLPHAPMVSSPEDSSPFEQFRPAPLSWLVTRLFRSRHESPPEPFDEHINGLA
jgi:hypothetical protein